MPCLPAAVAADVHLKNCWAGKPEGDGDCGHAISARAALLCVELALFALQRAAWGTGFAGGAAVCWDVISLLLSCFGLLLRCSCSALLCLASCDTP